MAGAAQSHRARCEAGGDPPQSGERRRDRPVRRNPRYSVAIGGRGEPGWRARRRRDRARWFARASNGGLIVTPSGLAAVHRDLIITLAARHRLPAIYPTRSFIVGGG